MWRKTSLYDAKCDPSPLYFFPSFCACHIDQLISETPIDGIDCACIDERDKRSLRENEMRQGWESLKNGVSYSVAGFVMLLWAVPSWHGIDLGTGSGWARMIVTALFGYPDGVM
jgi:hypothetical protein